ncbi:MAG: glycosyltransferase family 39 protein [Planctomycetota bacterium]
MTIAKPAEGGGGECSSRWFWPGVAACLFVQLVLAADCARQWTPTHDEYWHLPIGLRMWTTGRLDDDVINPPLVRLWASIPLVVCGATPGEAGPQPDVGDIGDAFWTANEARVRTWYFLGRLMIVPLATLTGLIVAVWARAWYGERAALISVLLWSCCPTALANAAIVTHDLPLTAAWMATLFALVRFAERSSWRTALVFGAALGAAQLTKLTALVLGPLGVVLWFVLRAGSLVEDAASIRTDAGSVGHDSDSCAGPKTSAKRGQFVAFWFSALAASLLVVNAGYLFRGTGTSIKALPLASSRLQAVQRAMSPCGWLPVPLPRDYVTAADRLAQDLERKHPVYLDGEWSDKPFARYYAAALRYKLPLSTLALLLVAFGVFAWPRPASQDRRRAAFLLLAAAVLPVLASGSTNQIGIRYILPTLPLLHLFAGQAARWLSDSRGRAVPFLVWTAVAMAPLALRFHPHHLAYFNLLAGGPVGGRWHLVDSNIDWGQDLHALKAYLDQHDVKDVRLAYFGTVIPSRVGIEAAAPPSRFPAPGWFAVSVNFVQGRPHAIRDAHGDRTQVGIDEFGYFRFFRPVARIGYSIDVYHLTEQDVARYAFELRKLQP